MKDTNECGPIYSVPLIASLPLTEGGMTQAMPSRADLEGIRRHGHGERVAAGYEVLLAHYRESQEKLAALREAIAEHHRQKADDRCIEDDDRLYAAAGLPPCDRHVGDKEAMLHNCARFIERRCEGGGWPSYAELEKELALHKKDLEDAAGELMVDIPHPDSEVAKLLRANGIMRRQRDMAEAKVRVLDSFSGVTAMLQSVLDQRYPPDIFAGGSEDVGPHLVAKARDIIKRLEGLRSDEVVKLQAETNRLKRELAELHRMRPSAVAPRELEGAD